jgi:lipopolysaccharide export system protein LptA
MFGDKKTNVAFFYGNVRVLHTPCTDPDEEVDVDRVYERKLPRGYLLMRCDKLEVRSRPREKGKPHQDMKATGRVTVRSDEFSGEAAQVSYDEEKDQVIFDGLGGLAVLNKVLRKGEPPQKIEGEKIFYRRSTGEHWGKGIRNVEGR